MGNKTNAIGFRMGINKNWISQWKAPTHKIESQWIIEDEKVRKIFIKDYDDAKIVKTIITRPTISSIKVQVYVITPSLIEKKLDEIKLKINKIVGRLTEVSVQFIQYANSAWSARLLAREIADSIEHLVSFRTAQKMAIRKAMGEKILGIKTRVGGRLGGVEMARSEGYTEGSMPLSTIRADIDYAHEIARTKSGVIGVRVWINRGEIFKKGLDNQVPVYAKKLNPRKGDYR